MEKVIDDAIEMMNAITLKEAFGSEVSLKIAFGGSYSFDIKHLMPSWVEMLRVFKTFFAINFDDVIFFVQFIQH